MSSNIISCRGKTPIIGKDCYVAPSAYLVGDLEIGESSSIWFNVTIRADVMPIRIGKQTNIQDGSVLHGTFGQAACSIGDRVTVGHSVVLHGCEIGDQCLIGMGSILMDNVKVGAESIVGAGSLVTEGTVIPPRSLFVGRPARFKRALTEEEISFLSKSADNYLLYKSWY